MCKIVCKDFDWLCLDKSNNNYCITLYKWLSNGIINICLFEQIHICSYQGINLLTCFNSGVKILDHGKLNLTHANEYYIDIIDNFKGILGYYVQHDEKIFYIEYSSENPIAFEVYLPDARSIMESIQFINKGPIFSQISDKK